MSDQWHRDGTDAEVRPHRVSRRQILRLAAAGAATSAITSLLAACGGTAPTATTAAASRAPSAAPAASAAPSAVPSASAAAAVSQAPSAAPSAASGSAPATPTRAPSTAPTAARPAGGGQLRMLFPFMTPVIDPAIGTSGYRMMAMGLGETLMYSTPQGVAQPWLAESVELIEPTRWRIRLREGVTFHNGKPLDGPAVQRSLARTFEKNATAVNLLNAAKVEAQDARTVILETKAPNGGVREILTSYYLIIHDAEEAAKVGDATFAQKPIMTGPFMATDFRPNEFVGARRYDKYWQGAATIERAETTLVSDGNARLAALLAGDVELSVTLPPQGLSQLRAANLTVVASPADVMYHIFLNNRRFPFDDRAVRQAISFAIDRKALVDRVLGGGEPARGVYPAHLSFAGPEPLPFDLQRARQTLDGAGWRAGADGVRAKDGKRLEFELLTYPGRPEFALLAPVVQAMLKEAGIAVSGIRSVEYSVQRLTSGDYDAMFIALSTAPTGDPSYILNLLFKSTADGNAQVGYQSPALDAVIERLTAEFDSARRVDLAREAQRILVEDTPIIFLAVPQHYMAHMQKLTGVEAHPVQQYLLNHRWKLG